MKMALADYREELAKTAAAIAAPGNWPWDKFDNRLLINENVWIIVLVTNINANLNCANHRQRHSCGWRVDEDHRQTSSIHRHWEHRGEQTDLQRYIILAIQVEAQVDRWITAFNLLKTLRPSLLRPRTWQVHLRRHSLRGDPLPEQHRGNPIRWPPKEERTLPRNQGRHRPPAPPRSRPYRDMVITWHYALLTHAISATFHPSWDCVEQI